MLKINNIAQLKGRFLASSPLMLDDKFLDSIIFVCDISPANSYGLIINFFENKNCEQLKGTIFESTKVFNGGPVDSKRIFMLHSNDHEWPQTLKISSEFYLTNVTDVLKKTEKMPKRYFILQGYTKWEEDQFIKELILGQWLVCDNADEEFLFSSDYSKKWKQAMSALSISENNYSSYVGTS